MSTEPTARTCRSSYYTDTGRRQHRGDREVRCGKPAGHADWHAEIDDDGDVIATWQRGVAAPAGTGSPTPATLLDGIAEVLSLPPDYSREAVELPQRILAERNAYAVHLAQALAGNARLRQDLDRARAELSQVQRERDAARQEAERAWSHMDGAHTDGRLAARELARQRDAAESALTALRADHEITRLQLEVVCRTVVEIADDYGVKAERLGPPTDETSGPDRVAWLLCDEICARLRALVTDHHLHPRSPSVATAP